MKFAKIVFLSVSLLSGGLIYSADAELAPSESSTSIIVENREETSILSTSQELGAVNLAVPTSVDQGEQQFSGSASETATASIAATAEDQAVAPVFASQEDELSGSFANTATVSEDQDRADYSGAGYSTSFNNQADNVGTADKVKSWFDTNWTKFKSVVGLDESRGERAAAGSTYNYNRDHSASAYNTGSTSAPAKVADKIKEWYNQAAHTISSWWNSDRSSNNNNTRGAQANTSAYAQNRQNIAREDVAASAGVVGVK